MRVSVCSQDSRPVCKGFQFKWTCRWAFYFLTHSIILRLSSRSYGKLQCQCGDMQICVEKTTEAEKGSTDNEMALNYSQQLVICHILRPILRILSHTYAFISFCQFFSRAKRMSWSWLRSSLKLKPSLPRLRPLSLVSCSNRQHVVIVAGERKLTSKV